MTGNCKGNFLELQMEQDDVLLAASMLVLVERGGARGVAGWKVTID